MKKYSSRHIVSDSRILGGKPIVSGTRISVEFILELLHSGMSMSDILAEYRHLTRNDIRNAIAFARNTVSRHVSVPLKLKMR